MTQKTKKVYSSGSEMGMLSSKGNGQYGYIIRSGWEECNFSEKTTSKILDLIHDPDVDQVYIRNNKLYILMLNGAEHHVEANLNRVNSKKSQQS